MGYPVAVLTTRPGQGSTTFSLSLAWDLASTSDVLLVDADMMGGTVGDALELDTDGRGIGNLLTAGAVDAAVLAGQAVVHQRRPRLHVVPGLRGFCGPAVSRLLPRLGPALAGAAEDFVILDLGCPLAFPDLESPRVTGEIISHSVRRTLVVLRDDPTLLPGSIQLLKAARIPQADLVVMKRPSSRMGRIAADVLATQLPGYPTWRFDWDDRKGQRATYEGRVVEHPGLGDTLRLRQAIRVG